MGHHNIPLNVEVPSIKLFLLADIHSTVQVVATIAVATTGGDGGMRRQLGRLQHVHRLHLLLDGEVKGIYSLKAWSEMKSEIFTLIIYESGARISIRLQIQ